MDTSSHVYQLRRGGYTLLKEKMKPEEKKRIAKDLYVVSRVKGNSMGGPPPVPFPIYRENALRYYVPRHYGIETFGPPESSLLSLGVKCPRLEFAGSLRDK